MFCSKCGKENPEGVRLCTSCGWALTTIAAAPAPDAKTSGIAIASLVLGILTPLTCLLTFLPAIICGIIALVKINKSRGQLKGSGLAIAGIAIPVAVLPIIAIITAIMIPALSKVRMEARRLVCTANMKQLGTSMMAYAADHNNILPRCENWSNEVKPYLGQTAEKLLSCPAGKCGSCTYAMNKDIKTLADIKSPEATVLLFESGPGLNQCGGPELLSTENHQGKGCNVLFADGHVEFIKTEDIPNLKWAPDTPPIIAPDNIGTL